MHPRAGETSRFPLASLLALVRAQHHSRPNKHYSAPTFDVELGKSTLVYKYQSLTCVLVEIRLGSE